MPGRKGMKKKKGKKWSNVLFCRGCRVLAIYDCLYSKGLKEKIVREKDWKTSYDTTRQR